MALSRKLISRGYPSYVCTMGLSSPILRRTPPLNANNTKTDGVAVFSVALLLCHAHKTLHNQILALRRLPASAVYLPAPGIFAVKVTLMRWVRVRFPAVIYLIPKLAQMLPRLCI